MSVTINQTIVLHVETIEEQGQRYDEVHLSYICTRNGKEVVYFTVTNGCWELLNAESDWQGKTVESLRIAASFMEAGKVETLVELFHDSQREILDLLDKYEVSI